MNTIYDTPTNKELLQILHLILVEIHATNDIEIANCLAGVFKDLPTQLLECGFYENASISYDDIINSAIPLMMDEKIHNFRNSINNPKPTPASDSSDLETIH